MRGARMWPMAIAGVLGATVLANFVILWAARDRNAAVVEPDYYRKAIAWDTTLAQRRVNDTLGWRIEAALLDPDAAGATVCVRIENRDGAPLAGAGVHLEAIHNAAAADPVRAMLVEHAPGWYQGQLPLRHRGLWELRFEVMRGEERFTASLRRDTEAPPPAGFVSGRAAPAPATETGP
jgi:nitrogen fixation protein FixH